MKTAGSILKDARKKRGLTFKQIWEKTRIHPKFLQALEEGSYSIFSSPVHIKGFLRTYARFLELDEQEVMAFFRREYDETREQKDVAAVMPLRRLRTLWTPGWLVSAVGVVLVLAFLLYLLLGYTHYAGPPLLIVDKPESDMVLEENRIEVSGRTSRGVDVSLNGESLPLSESGRFSATISLSYGVNTLEFIAVNPWGRKTVVTRTVVVKMPAEE